MRKLASCGQFRLAALKTRMTPFVFTVRSPQSLIINSSKFFDLARFDSLLHTQLKVSSTTNVIVVAEVKNGFDDLQDCSACRSFQHVLSGVRLYIH